MKVFVAGASGALGKRVVDGLADRGHEVVGLVRDDEGEQVVDARGGVPRRGDVLDTDSLEQALPDGVDVVVHAATALPTAEDPDDEEWERNDRVRREGASNLVAAAGEAADRFVFPSVIWVARQPDGSAFDESDARHPDRFTRSAADVEDFLREAGGEHGFDVTILRNGLFYGPEDHNTRNFARRLLSGDLPVIGGGLLGRRDAAFSFLHADDAGRAATAAVDAGVTGLYHVVDEEPVAVAEFLRAFADLLDAPAPKRVPWWLVRPLAGKDAVRFMTSPMPTSSAKFRRDVDWEPRYPTYREGLRDVVENWQRDGTLRETPEGCEWNGA